MASSNSGVSRLNSIPPPAQDSQSDKTKKSRRHRILKPLEYADAVQAYSLLRTGAGQNHIALGEFLTSQSAYLNINVRTQEKESFVTLYSLTTPTQKASEHQSGAETEGNRTSSHLIEQPKYFYNAGEFYNYNLPSLDGRTPQRQSQIIFLRGYMSADWLNHIGAKYVVDPEYFCRHLDFRPPDDNSNNFSIPALPSSSWHLIQLPVLTIGTHDRAKIPSSLDAIELLRQRGRDALALHHHRIARLSSSGMRTGDSMVRAFYTFDETHFVIEQRISICMQQSRGSFTLLVWLDSGRDFPIEADGPSPWCTNGVASRLLPVIRHTHMVALKSHLFTDIANTGPAGDLRDDQSASRLHMGYGRSLRPAAMAEDAFYALTEVFSFAASSEMSFLNLLDIKLNRYTENVTRDELISLQNLRYTKEILYQHVQKIQQVLDSIRNAQQGKWPKATALRNQRKATTAAERLDQDFRHLLSRAEVLHKRCNEAITVLMSSISISESKRAIEQTERVTRLTFLAFIFVPLSFTTSFFGMNVKELVDETSRLSIYWWVVMSVPVSGLAIALFYYDVTKPFRLAYAFLRRLIL